KILACAFGGHQAKLSVVEVERAVLLDCAEKAGSDHSQRLHYFEVLGEDVLLGKSDGELGEFECVIGILAQLVALGGSQWLAESAGNGSLGMDGLARQDFQHVGTHVAHFHHSSGNVGRCLEHADDIADGIVGIGAEQEISSRQEVEVQDVLFHKRDAVAQLAQLLSRRGRLDSKDRVASLGRSQVMRPRTHTADARCDAWEVFYGASEAKLLEAAQFNDVYPGGVHVARVVQLNGHLGVALNAGDRLYDQCLCHGSPPGQRPQTASASKTVESCGPIRNLLGIEA